MKILTFFVRYGKSQYPNSLERLKYHNQKNFKNHWENKIIVIDNSLPSHFMEYEDDLLVCGGDNLVREFTGWDRLISETHMQFTDYNLIQFVTSAFEQLSTWYLDSMSLSVVEAMFNNNNCIYGHVDSYPEHVSINEYKFKSWIRSCFFFIDPQCLLKLERLCTIKDFYYFNNEYDPKNIFKSNAICAKYQKYILDWITGDGYDEAKWHSRFELNSQSYEAFKIKALCIFNEHMLTVKAISKEIDVCDITWLSKNLSAEFIPNLKFQIDQRHL